MGLSYHGIERGSLDGIETSRDCTGRDFTRRKKHGIAWDGMQRAAKSTGLHETGCNGPQKARDYMGRE